MGKLVGHGDMVRSIIGSWGGDYVSIPFFLLWIWCWVFGWWVTD